MFFFFVVFFVFNKKNKNCYHISTSPLSHGTLLARLFAVCTHMQISEGEAEAGGGGGSGREGWEMDVNVE